MKIETRTLLLSLSTAEKIEVVQALMVDINHVCEELDNVRRRSREYCQGMLMNRAEHGLKCRVVSQLETIVGLAEDVKEL